jgi:hypothetical protein
MYIAVAARRLIVAVENWFELENCSEDAGAVYV